MRILHIGKYYAPQRGGIEAHTQALARACTRLGDTVRVLVHREAGQWRTVDEVLDGVPVRRVGCLAAPVYTPISPSFPWQLARTLREFAPDVVHMHLPNPSCFAALVSARARAVPWIVHWHADVPPDAPDWRLRVGYRAYRPFEQRLLQWSDTIIATSSPYAAASAALSRWQRKVEIVPLGVDDVPPAMPGAIGWPTDGLRLLAVGRLGAYKGFDVLIDALADAPGASLVLVGSGERDAALRAQARARGVESRVRFAGGIDDASLAAAYADADVFVLPSLDRGEAFGLVLLEAMRAGRAVIASDIAGSGTGFVVEDGVTGLLVPPGDAPALAAAISRLQDASLRARLGDAGRRRWAAHFTLAEAVDRTRAIYRRAVERRRAATTPR